MTRSRSPAFTCLRAFSSALPSSSLGFNLAPASSSSSTTSAWPNTEATMRGVLPSFRRSSSFAPASMRSLTHAGRPPSHAAYSGVLPSIAGWLTFTLLCCSSNLTHWSLPFWHAIHSGVNLCVFVALLGKAPALSSSCAHSTCPDLHAVKRGVTPSGVLASTSAPTDSSEKIDWSPSAAFFSSRYTRSLSPISHAWNSRPFGSSIAARSASFLTTSAFAVIWSTTSRLRASRDSNAFSLSSA
mmetsp:Transcript_29368/g.73362  ORF Transcript_29368/g.73362 Transcript_29368/m.73362 type:complete len:242 (+) Transcript_29368:504-1229(+)